MLITTVKHGLFKVKEVWFADAPYDIDDCHSVVFKDCRNRVDNDGFRLNEFATIVVDLQQDLDAIWDKFHKKSCQYQIKRAERDGVKVERCYNCFEFLRFNEPFRQARGIKGKLDYAYIVKYGLLFVARINGEVVAAQMYLRDADTIRWLHGASKRLETDNPLIGCASRLLIWEVIKYAKTNGIKEFDFGGYSPDVDSQYKSISFFKGSFGGDVINRYIYAKNYSGLYSVAQKVKGLIA